MRMCMTKERKPFLLKLFMLWAFVFVWATAFAQNSITISGTVSDDVESLPGVSVAVKGTTIGTITDVNGKFTLSVPNEKSVLTFSYVGYTPQSVTVGSTRNFNITMKSDEQLLDEVVVIGYGAVKKRDLTGSTASVRGTEIAQIPVTTAAQAISGKLAGVNVVTTSGAPGADIDIIVRGGTSITQSTKPLYIVDGFQVEDGLKNVDINDIESIDVMKDASATAIYGVKGSNGVIIITTKSGKAGKTEVNYNGYLSFERLGNKLDLLGVSDYVKYQYEFQTLRGQQPQWESMFGGTAGSGAYDYINKEYGNRSGIDWQEEMFGGTALLQSHNVSVTGGNEKTKFMLSYNYTGQDGILDKTGYTKNSIRAKINHELWKGVRLDVSGNFNNTQLDGDGSMGGMLKMSALQPVTGGVRFTNEQMLHSDISTEMALIDSQYDINNPIITNDAVTQNKYTRQVTFNAGLDVDIPWVKGLTFRTAGSYFWQQVRNDYWDDGRTKKAEVNKGPWGKRNNSERNTWQITNTLNWKRDFGAHGLNILLGQETSEYNSMKLENIYYEFPENNFGLNDVSMAGRVGDYKSGKERERLFSLFGRVMYNYGGRYLVTATLRGDATSKFKRGNQWGAFPSASAAWRISEEAFMESTKDIVNNLKLRVGYGVTGNNNIDNNMYATDYGSTQYVVNGKEVSGLKPGDTVGNSYLEWEKTTTTNIGLDVSVFNSRLNLSVDWYNNESGNLLIKNEIPTSTGYKYQFQNIGKIRNRGFEFLVNSVNIKTKDFTWATDFNISFNRSKVLSLYDGEERSAMAPQTVDDGHAQFWVEEGQPLGQFYGYIYDGVYTTNDFEVDAAGNYTKLKDGIASLKGKSRDTIKPGDVKYKTTAGDVDSDGNPVWSTSDRTVIGNSQPDFTGGMTNTFTYKGFDLSIFVNFSYGNQIVNMNSQRFIGPYLANQNSLTVMNDRFVLVDPATGQETKNLARLAELNPQQHNKTAMWSLNGDNKIAITDPLDYYLEDGSFLRLSNITLGYSLPKSLLNKAYINKARIYCTLNNIHTFTKYKGYDPEVSSKSGALTRGVDNSAYPKTKSVVVGVNLTF